MPRYDTLNCRHNPSELDPCIAAEVRLKDSHYSWKIIGGGLAILLLILVGIVVICAVSFTSKYPILTQSNSLLGARPHTTTTYPPITDSNSFYNSRADFNRRMQIIQDREEELRMIEMKPPATGKKPMLNKVQVDKNQMTDKKPTFDNPTVVKAVETPFVPVFQQESTWKAPVTVKVTSPPATTTIKTTNLPTTRRTQFPVKVFEFKASELPQTTTTLRSLDSTTPKYEKVTESSRPDIVPPATTATLLQFTTTPTSRPTIQIPAYSTRSDKLLTAKYIRPRAISPHPAKVIDNSGKFETCDGYLKNGYTMTGVYRLRSNNYDFLAQCEMGNDGKAWMVMQKRTSNSLIFWNRTFEEYAEGFGDATTDNWLGLRKIRQIIESGKHLQLQMEIEGDRCGTGEDSYYVGVWDFAIDSEEEDFRLHVSKILHGNFTDPLSNIANSNGLQFNSIRQEGTNLFSCLDRVHMGGWWSVENGCPFISLNGEYSCARANSMYGLSVYYRRPNRSNAGSFTTSYIRPQATRMMLRVCGDPECL